MARYIQRIALLGKERWIGWEIDGVGTEIPGLMLADEMTEDELRARGIKEFRTMPFENFLGMGASFNTSAADGDLLDEDIEYRLDALLVSMERIRSRGVTTVARSLLLGFFDERQLHHPRVISRIAEWEDDGRVQFVGAEECYLRIVGRLA
jgi:hypothetical protein